MPQGLPGTLHPGQRLRRDQGPETTALSFIVNRPADEPGFRVDRQEVADRRIRYTTHSYATGRPEGARYGTP